MKCKCFVQSNASGGLTQQHKTCPTSKVRLSMGRSSAERTYLNKTDAAARSPIKTVSWDMLRHAETRFNETRQDVTGCDAMLEALTRRDKIWQDVTRCHKMRQDATDKTRCCRNVTRCDKPRQDMTRYDKMRQDGTRCPPEKTCCFLRVAVGFPAKPTSTRTAQGIFHILIYIYIFIIIYIIHMFIQFLAADHIECRLQCVHSNKEDSGWCTFTFAYVRILSLTGSASLLRDRVAYWGFLLRRLGPSCRWALHSEPNELAAHVDTTALVYYWCSRMLKDAQGCSRMLKGFQGFGFCKGGRCGRFPRRSDVVENEMISVLESERKAHLQKLIVGAFVAPRIWPYTVRFFACPLWDLEYLSGIRKSKEQDLHNSRYNCGIIQVKPPRDREGSQRIVPQMKAISKVGSKWVECEKEEV